MKTRNVLGDDRQLGAQGDGFDLSGMPLDRWRALENNAWPTLDRQPPSAAEPSQIASLLVAQASLNGNQGPGPVSDADPGADLVAEDAIAGISAGITARASDPDGDALTYSLIDDAGGRFRINPATGEVSVADPAKLDFETAPNGQYEIVVQAADDGGLFSTQSFTIAIGNRSDLVTLATLGVQSGFVIQGDAAKDWAGFSVARAGDVNGDGYGDLIVGAPWGDDGGEDAGEAYVVFGSAGGFGVADGSGRQVIDLTSLSAAQGFIIQGDAANDDTGLSVASAGDVNGDGYGDLIVGAPIFHGGGTKTYVVFGGADGFGATVTTNGFPRQVIDLTSLSAAQGFIVQGDAVGDNAGWSVASAGDVNGDGYGDLIVGASFSLDEGGGGKAYVVFGGADGFGATVVTDGSPRQVVDLTSLTAAQGFIIQADAADDDAGESVASAGDVNGDGYGDLIVGAPWGDDGGESAGEAYIVFGGADGFGATVVTDGIARQVIDLTTLSAAQGFVIQGDAARDSAGQSVASAGDVNGDGFADLVIGAPFGDDGGENAGEAYVVFGGACGFGATVVTDGFARQVVDLTSLSAAQGFVIQGNADATTAWSVASGGDVNGDGYDDLILEAGWRGDGGNNGGAYVLFGGAHGFGVPAVTDGFARQVVDLTALSAAQGFAIRSDAVDDLAGFSVASAGDVDGDGFADLIIGAPYGDDGGIHAGEAYVVFGGDLSGKVTQRGSSGADTLIGAGAADVMIGGLGDDTLYGGGGGDVIKGGGGSDVIHVLDSGFLRVDGGGGADRLIFEYAGTVDLGNIDNDAALSDRGRIQGIERLDFSNGQANAVILRFADLLDLGVGNHDVGGAIDLDNTLRIDGEAGDGLTLFAADGWSAADTALLPGYAVYGKGGAAIAVDADILVQTI